MNERRTSAAKDILDQRVDAALERYGFAQEQFQAAAEQDVDRREDRSPQAGFERDVEHTDRRADAALERYGLNEERGSEMVRNDRPHPAPRPSWEGARDVDRQSFDDRWSAEQNQMRDQRQDDYGR